MTNRSQGAGPEMITVDCPWCDGPAVLAATELHCPECAVTVPIAPGAPLATPEAAPAAA